MRDHINNRVVYSSEHQKAVFFVFCFCLTPGVYSGDVGGELLVDIGSGPTLYQVLSGCEVFNKVLLTDFLEVNRQELRHWLQDKGGRHLDWTPYLQHVCKLEGRRYDQVPLRKVRQ